MRQKSLEGIDQLCQEMGERMSLEVEAYQFFTDISVPKLKRVNSDGKAKKVTMAIPAVIKTVEITSCLFKVGSISLTRLISKRSVAKSVVIKQTTIPIELTIRG